MRIHCLQHLPFDDSSAIGVWSRYRKHELSHSAMLENPPLPSIDDVDWLVVLGGFMNIYEEHKHPWLRREKRFIMQAIERGKLVLGLCLGAQLMADLLGGPVMRNQNPEIGWHEVTMCDGAGGPVFEGFPSKFTAFQWHRDTFAIPPAATRLSHSGACGNQGFRYGHRVVGLQFHLECTDPTVVELVQRCGGDLVDGPYIQRPEQMLSQHEKIAESYRLLEKLMDAMERQALPAAERRPAKLVSGRMMRAV